MATLRYALINAAYWGGFCLLLGFASVFLLARGLSNTQIGLVVAFSGLISAILQPVVAQLADRSRQPLRVWVAGLAVLVGTAAAGLLLPATIWRDALLYGLALCALQLATPLINALGMRAAHEGTPVDFGSARAVGSLTFALTSLLVGALVARTSAEVIPPLVMATQAALILAVLTFVLNRTVIRGSDANDVVGVAVIERVAALTTAQRRSFVVLLIGITGCYASHAVINTFIFQIVESHGGTSADLGVALLIAASLEVIPLFLFSRIVSRWQPATLLRVAALAYLVRIVAAAFASSLPAFLATQTLQVVSFGLIVPATVYYVDRMLPPADRLRGQAFMTLTLTLGNVLAGLGGGVLLDQRGVPTLLVAGAVVTALGVVGVFAGTTGQDSSRSVDVLQQG